jgi:hypothetical protein
MILNLYSSPSTLVRIRCVILALLLSTLDVALAGTAGAQTSSGWKGYRSAEYEFEIRYPAEWELDESYQNNYGKLPSPGQRPAYAGETRTLFDLEMDGPTQSHEGGGSFDDGAIIDVRITGTGGSVEDWNFSPGRSPYVTNSTPSDWVRLHSSPGGGDGVQTMAVDTNGFIGAVAVVCTGSNPCKSFEEAGGAYRTLPGGRILLVSWERETGGNDFSQQKYFLPMLASFKLLK